MSELSSEKYIDLPLLALRGLTVFSGVLLHFDVGRDKSVKALEQAMANGQMIFLVAQKDIVTENPQRSDLYDVGTISRIKQILRLPGDSIRVLVEGINRAEIINITQTDPFYTAEVEEWKDQPADTESPLSQALVRRCQAVFDEYASLIHKLNSEIVLKVIDSRDPGYLADYLAANLAIHLEDKQSILQERDPIKRIEHIIAILENEIQILNIEQSINIKIKEQIEKNQREYYLREQLKVIQGELDDSEGVLSDCNEYRDRILKLKLQPEAEEKLLKEVDRLSKTAFGSSEGMVIRTYLDACVELPWNIKTKDRNDIVRARKILDKDHYGLEKVKERILEFLSVRQLNPTLKNQIICLVGPPGVGKTSIGISIANALKRKYARLSLGGIRDEADIRGHRKTYIGAMPGRIIAALKIAGSNNPVLLLDEVDKLSSDYRGDPSAALLEVLDSEQNQAFRDHYIELAFDLSDVLFITTANTTDTIPRPLLDRMEVIEISSYTSDEKFNIAKRHLLPKQLKRHGINKGVLLIDDETICNIIDGYTRESGVRSLEREIAKICRKAAKKIVSEGVKKVTIKPDDLKEFLGIRKYHFDKIGPCDEIGVACGLAWTSVGGETLFVEVNVVDGTGKVELTGQLGDVMKESAHAAISYIRSRADSLGINKNFYKEYDIHAHFPEGATPKDGPSAGITMATAIISALTGTPIRHDTAMTGEVTIRGRVLEIGGLKEKAMAAYRAGIKRVIIPKDNIKDLEELDEVVRSGIEFLPAETMDKVLEEALLPIDMADETLRCNDNIQKNTIMHKINENINGENQIRQ